LEALAEGLNTKDELIKKIEDVFSDSKKEGISLSTIHKAKGLESTNVYIACPSLMPSKSAKQQWEKEQEHNLMYVAFTRAKEKLIFLDGEEYNYLLKSSSNNLEKIEKQVNLILNKNTVLHITSVEDAINIIEKSTPIQQPIKTNKTLLTANKNNTNKLSSFTNKRLVKRN
jgi:ATP-dependent exoDNAse (exonuclease V) beta subunit